MPRTVKEAVKAAAPPFQAKRIREILRESLAIGGITAEIESEPVPLTRLHRFWVISEQFRRMRVAERQAYIWQLVRNTLKPEEQLRISMILPLTPEEYEGRG